MLSQYQITDLIHGNHDRLVSSKVGFEGRVFLHNDQAIKVYHTTKEPNVTLGVQFAERRRRAVHGFFLSLLQGECLAIDSLHRLWRFERRTSQLTLLTIQQATSTRNDCIGTFSTIHGAQVPLPHKELYDAARIIGVSIDCYGRNNVIASKTSTATTYTILETLRGIHLEGLLQLQALKKLQSPHYQKALYFLSWAIKLQGVSPYPTTPYERLRDDYDDPYSNDPSNFWRNLSRYHKSSRFNGVELAELHRAKALFGKQFSPQGFDYQAFTNYENFGLERQTVDEIKEALNRISTAADKVLQTK